MGLITAPASALRLWPVLAGLIVSTVAAVYITGMQFYETPYGDASVYLGYFHSADFTNVIQGYQPGFPMLMALLGQVFDDPTVLRVFFIALMFASTTLTCVVLDRYMGPLLAVLCAIAVSCNIPNLIYSNNVQTDAISYHLSLILFLMTLWLAEAEKVRIWQIVLMVAVGLFYASVRSSNIFTIGVLLAGLALARFSRLADLRVILIGLASALVAYFAYMSTLGNFNHSGENFRRVLMAADVDASYAPFFRAGGLDVLADHLEAANTVQGLENNFLDGVWGDPFNEYMRKTTMYVATKRPSLIAAGVAKNIFLYFRNELRAPYPEDPNYPAVGVDPEGKLIPADRGRQDRQYETIKFFVGLSLALYLLFAVIPQKRDAGWVALHFSAATFVSIAAPLVLVWSPLWWGDSTRLFYLTLPFAATILALLAARVAAWCWTQGRAHGPGLRRRVVTAFSFAKPEKGGPESAVQAAE